MSQLDVVKEQIAYLKVWLGILVVTDISLSGWFVASLNSAKALLLFAGVIGVVTITVTIYMLHLHIERRIESLKNL